MTGPGSDEERPVGPPSDVGEPYRHPADHSWNLQMLLSLQGTVSKLEERTNALGSKVDDVRDDMRGFIRRGEFWTGIGIIVTLLLGLAAIYAAAAPEPSPQPAQHAPAPAESPAP